MNPNEKTSGNESSASVPMIECPGCGTLVTKHPGPERPCKVCGDTRSGREFPPDRQRRLDARIRRYYAEGDYEVVVILAATFLETLLEDALARIMESQGASVRLRAAVLDTQRSVGQRLGKLFPTLTGKQFEEVCAEFGFAHFPRRWRALRTERNAFIHDSAFEGAREELNVTTATEATELLDQAYKLFAAINNRFAVHDQHRRRNT